MADRPPKIVICSCEDTMPLDIDTIAKACRGADVVPGRQFCRAELERLFKARHPRKDADEITKMVDEAISSRSTAAK